MYYIGVDLGGTNIAVGIVDEKFHIVRKGSVPTVATREADAIIADMGALCLRLLKEENLTMADIASVGVSTPGSANSDTGIVEYANNLPFVFYPLAAKLGAILGTDKVYIENDANAAAKAEAMAGVAVGTKYSVMITLGTGLGGGIVLDGKVYSGFNHAGAELGHFVIEKDGRPCSCGRRGCWEAYSSATGLVNITKDRLAGFMKEGRKTMMTEMTGGDVSKVNARTAFDAMKKGDAAAAEVVDEYISYLASGCASIINIFQPNVLSIGGGICGEGDNLLIPLKEKVYKEIYTKPPTPLTEIKIAKLGNDAGIIGAATLGV